MALSNLKGKFIIQGVKFQESVCKAHCTRIWFLKRSSSRLCTEAANSKIKEETGGRRESDLIPRRKNALGGSWNCNKANKTRSPGRQPGTSGCFHWLPHWDGSSRGPACLHTPRVSMRSEADASKFRTCRTVLCAEIHTAGRRNPHSSQRPTWLSPWVCGKDLISTSQETQMTTWPRNRYFHSLKNKESFGRLQSANA